MIEGGTIKNQIESIKKMDDVGWFFYAWGLTNLVYGS